MKEYEAMTNAELRALVRDLDGRVTALEAAPDATPTEPETPEATEPEAKPKRGRPAKADAGA